MRAIPFRLPSPNPESARLSAGPVLYVAVLALLTKLARAADLALGAESLEPWLMVWPGLLGDLTLVLGVGLLAQGAARLAWPRTRTALLWLVLLPIGVVLAANVPSYRITGAPITWQRLRGDEGATLLDLDLLAPSDLALAVGGIMLAIGSLWGALRYAPRWSRLAAACELRRLLPAFVLALGALGLQGRLLPQLYGLDEQPLFALVESFAGGPALKGVRLNDGQWRALLAPQEKAAPDRVPPRVGKPPRNVVLFLAEGIPFEHTGMSKQHTPDPTPNLSARLQRQGVLFSHYYANWHASIQAIFSVVCSSFPPMYGDIVRINPRIDCGEFSEVLRERGVTSGLFHGGHFNFYNKLALLGRRGYAVEMDTEELRRAGSKRALNQWGIDDRAVVEATLKWVDTLPHGQPFAALLIPITAHYPYYTPPDFKGAQKGRSRLAKFLRAVEFQDQVFESLVKGLEKRGLADDTLFVWLGDHGHAVGEPVRPTPGVRMFYEANLRTGMVLLNSRLFPASVAKADRESKRLGSHVDLLPTILDALGFDGDRRHMGQSLLSDDYEPRRVYFGAKEGAYVGFVDQGRKFALEVRTKRTEYYDLNADPDELHDLSASDPRRMARYSQDALSYARGVQARVDSAPSLDERFSVRNLYELALRDVVAEIVDAASATATVCPAAGPEQRNCPGLGNLLSVKQQRVQAEMRRCLFVKVPPQGKSVRLTFDDPNLLELMGGGTMLATKEPAKTRVRFRARVSIDGKLHRSANLTAAVASPLDHPEAKHSLSYELDRSGGADTAQICLQMTKLLEN
jgi:hypothetical protein